MFPESDEHPVTSSGGSSLHHVLTDDDILGQVCCYGAVSQSDAVARLSRQLLTRLLSQSIAPTEEASCSDIKRLLLQWIPYIEVHVRRFYLDRFSVKAMDKYVGGRGGPNDSPPINGKHPL